MRMFNILPYGRVMLTLQNTSCIWHRTMQDATLKPANFMRMFNILPYGRVMLTLQNTSCIWHGTMQDATLKPANFMRMFNILPYGRVMLTLQNTSCIWHGTMQDATLKPANFMCLTSSPMEEFVLILQNTSCIMAQNHAGCPTETCKLPCGWGVKHPPLWKSLTKTHSIREHVQTGWVRLHFIRW
jgi:hypothetical protein